MQKGGNKRSIIASLTVKVAPLLYSVHTFGIDQDVRQCSKSVHCTSNESHIRQGRILLDSFSIMSVQVLLNMKRYIPCYLSTIHQKGSKFLTIFKPGFFGFL